MTQGDRELDDAQPGPDVPARLRDDVDQAATDLVGQRLKLLLREPLHISGVVDGIEQGHGGQLGRVTI